VCTEITTYGTSLSEGHIDLNCGLVEIEWTSPPVVTLKAVGLDGRVAFEYDVTQE
jgi:hypothetical protein